MTTATAPNQRTSPAAPAPAQTTDPDAPLIDPVLLTVVSSLEKSAESIAHQLNDAALGRLRLSLMKGMAIKRLRALINPQITAILMEMMNTKHGFRTDRGPKQKKDDAKTPYSKDVVIDCAIAALLDGVLWAGNHWNIIAGECYITGDGWEYKLQNLPGFSDLTPLPGTPHTHNGQTCVRYGASWKMNGVKNQLVDAKGEPGIIFAIRTDSYSSPDQIVGKARAKALKLVYKTITSSVQTYGDDDDIEILADLPGRISDRQESDLNAAIQEYEASPLLIQGFFKLAPGDRLMEKDFTACMAKIRNRDFSAPEEKPAKGAPLAITDDGEIPSEREYSADDVINALAKIKLMNTIDMMDVWKGYGVKRAADLTQDQRREIMSDLERDAAE